MISPSVEQVPSTAPSEPKGISSAPAWLLRLFPCLTDLAFVFPIAALYTFLEGARTLLGDGDTGWHIRTGDWILQHGQIPRQDIFSFTKPNDQWFAWEWGWDVLFSIIHSHWSLSGVVFANVLILGIVGVLIYRLVRRHAPNDAMAFLLTAAALCASSLHWLARPHLLSWIFILAFLHLIERAEQGQTRSLRWTPVLMLLWVNLHGSFFIGIFFLFTYAVAHALEDIVLAGRSPREGILRHRAYFLSGLACLAVSFINPYGWRLHEHVIGYLLDASQLAGISEFASLDFHSPLAIRFELFLVLGVLAAYRLIRSGQWSQAAMILIWAHMSLKSARNVPIFVFIAAPPSACFLKACLEWARVRLNPSWLRNAAKAVSSLGRDFQAFERVERFPLLPVACLVLFAVSLGLLPFERARIHEFDARDFPVAAAAVISQQHDPRIFTFDQWGDYLIYRFFPQRRAFVDGRSDFYGTAFGQEWVSALKAEYNWNAALSRYSIDTVLLRPHDALSSVLKESRQWTSVYDDGSAIVFRRVVSHHLETR